MTKEEDYKLAKRIDELLCTEFDKHNPDVQKAAMILNIEKNEGPHRHGVHVWDSRSALVEHYCLTLAEKKALREFGRFDELKRIYGEDE